VRQGDSRGQEGRELFHRDFDRDLDCDLDFDLDCEFCDLS
jgi:hypothetical protein